MASVHRAYLSGASSAFRRDSTSKASDLRFSLWEGRSKQAGGRTTCTRSSLTPRLAFAIEISHIDGLVR